ncbi:MAG: metal ABC transporter permease [Candidatus Woesearchaeota archaeon]
MLEMFQYAFMQRALITGVVIAIACALLGVFLVLKKYALLGDGIAHISFGGVATGLLFNITPFLSALFFSIIGALGILNIKERAKLHGDSAIGIVSHASLGIGIFILSIARGFNVDILSFLFGSILAIKVSEMYLSIGLAIAVIVLIFAFYHELFASTFDEDAAKTLGINAHRLDTLLIVLTAITIVSAMRVVGLMLASALLILPAATALQCNVSFKKTLFVAVLISIFSVFFGLVLAFIFDFAVSGTIVLLNAGFFIGVLLIKRIYNYILQKPF